MSTLITTAMVDTYNVGFETLAQQLQSKLIDRVRTEAEPGERVSFDQVGAVAAKEVVTRHGDTQYVNTPHRRRWAIPKDWAVADLLDEQDLVRILSNPGGEYGKVFIAALNRERDKAIIDAALGNALTGKTGTDIVALPAGQQIAHGGTGFTLAKVKDALKRMKAGNALEMGSELTIAWTSAQEDEFLDTTEVKSIDFNTQRVLVDGGMGDDKFYAFQYIRLEDWTDQEGILHQILPKTGTVRSCVAWVKEGLLLNDPKPPLVRAEQLPGKNYAWQYHACSTFGTTRMQEVKVVQIDVQEP